MQIKIIPYKSVGKLKFGMNHSEIHKILGNPDNSFLRNEYSISKTDEYKEHSFFVEYDEEDKFCAIETWNPLLFEVDGIALLNDMNYSNLLSKFKTQDTDITEDSNSFTSKKYGISVWLSDKNYNQKNECESMLIFSKGYFPE